MRRTKSKQYRRQAEDWCFRALHASFPDEVVDTMDREELWALAFPETHYSRVYQHPYKKDDDGDPVTYRCTHLFNMSPRWIYKQIKKNPQIRYEDLEVSI